MWEGAPVRVDLPIALSPANLADLANPGTYVRDLYRLHFTHELAAGALRPMVIPYALLGTVFLPVLYFSVPHARRPWLYRARLPLLLLILALNVHEALTTSSANFAVGYGIGLMQGWGVLWAATLLVWTSPQLEAERVERRKSATRPAGVVGTAAVNGSSADDGRAGNGHVLRGGGPPQDGHAAQNGRSPLAALDGTVEPSKRHSKANETSQGVDAPDEDIARSLREGYEYYWQAYPADAPFSTRFDWSLDLVTSFRGTGWNWCVPVLPHFAKPEKPLSGSLVDLNSIPVSTRQGYRRYATVREWLRAKLVSLALGYLALDLLSVTMMKDPYFILGPDFANKTAEAVTALSLPPFLASLPQPVLFTYRSLACFAAIFLAIENIFLCFQLLSHFALRGLFGTRAELWHFPSVFGGFTYGVLDRGMAGFWGGWWHQTFRAAFGAPGLWLGRGGYVDPRSPRGRAVAGLLAFAQSGFLHGLGSVSCLPPGRPWAPPAFFLLSWAGVLAQAAGCAALRRLAGGAADTARLPVAVRRAGNFLFVFAWLNATQFLLSDDLARAGIWLLEPVPVSLFRALGLGRPGDSWWRWDAFLWPRWWAGRNWWQSGIAM